MYVHVLYVHIYILYTFGGLINQLSYAKIALFSYKFSTNHVLLIIETMITYIVI